MKTGIELIADERQEQIEKHGYSQSHDKGHEFGVLAKIAAVLAVLHTDAKVIDPDGWDSDSDVCELPSKLAGNPIHALKVAGALIAAEIDRLQNL